MKSSQFIIVLVLSSAVAFATASGASRLFTRDVTSSPATHETRLEQVKRTGVIRCGYVTWPPYLVRDPNTGKMSGAFYEMVEEFGKQLQLKIDWVGEVVMGQMLADLELNRYDMVCVPVGQTPGRAREADFLGPISYLPINLYVRKDDARFDQGFEAANRPEVKFAALDGELSRWAADEFFPAATKVAMTQLSNGTDLFMMVASGKADAVIQDPYAYSDYDVNNPGVLRQAGNKSLRVVSMGMPIPANEPAFKAMLNTTLSYLHDSGFIDKTLKKYETSVKFVRLAKPYKE